MAHFLVKSWVGLAALALLAAATQPAVAQRGGGRGFGGGMMRPVAKARLATLSEVQTELKLNDEQKSKISAVSDQLVSDTRGLFGGGGDRAEAMKKADELNKDASTKVDALLDSPQQKRLQEISIQVNGASTLSDAAVQQQLQLTEDQKKKLEDVRQENQQAAFDMFSNAGQLSREEMRAKMDDLRKAGTDKLMGVLTDEQKTAFEALKGTPLTVDLSQLRRGFGGGGGGGGGGAGGGTPNN
jgi:Spy/CpxP family protein refolding chaperone